MIFCNVTQQSLAYCLILSHIYWSLFECWQMWVKLLINEVTSCPIFSQKLEIKHCKFSQAPWKKTQLWGFSSKLNLGFPFFNWTAVLEGSLKLLITTSLSNWQEMWLLEDQSLNPWLPQKRSSLLEPTLPGARWRVWEELPVCFTSQSRWDTL